MTILLISDSDRTAFACNLLAKQLEKRGKDCLTVGLPMDQRRDSPLPFLRPQVILSLDNLLGSPLIERASALGVFLKQPRKLEVFTESLRNLATQANRAAPPVFSGPLRASLGDRLMQELYEHLGCDLLLLPGERQHQSVHAVTQHWPQETKKPRLLTTGLWYMPERPSTGNLNGGVSNPPHLLLVLLQETLPSITGGKSQFLRQLIRLAKASPDWYVMLQRDCSWEKGTSWIPRTKSKKKLSLPKNLVFAAPGQLLRHLASCSACITISSPWAITAMAWGRKTMMVGDYGIHTNEGTTSWFGCGSMHTLESIESLEQLLELPGTNQAWLEAMGWGIHDGVDRLIKTLDELKS